jgi:hydrogenase/urease accessory protein HupE
MPHRYGKHWTGAIGALLLGLLSLGAAAHEFTPGYLGLTESAANTFEVQWKLSTTGGLQKVLSPQLPESCQAGEVRQYVVGDGEIRRWRITCPQGLAGSTIQIDGLEQTATDVLLRIDYLDGSSLTRRLDANNASVVVPAQAGWVDVSASYLVLGVEHILGGIDHLLFVLALLLIVNGVKRLVLTITAFTLAHSITLGAATLGFVTVQGPPVEAVIALSILFLASELARRPVGSSAGDDDLLNRYPWLVSFSFGLLHGFGFAGALAGVGLPEKAIPLALLFFNVGVEVGQLLFIAVVLLLGRLVVRASLPIPAAWPRIAAYGIGSLAAFWVIERTLSAF